MKQEPLSVLTVTGMTKSILYNTEDFIVEVEDLITIEDAEEPCSPCFTRAVGTSQDAYYSKADVFVDTKSKNSACTMAQMKDGDIDHGLDRGTVRCTVDHDDAMDPGASDIQVQDVYSSEGRGSAVFENDSDDCDLDKCDIFEPETLIVEFEEPIEFVDDSRQFARGEEVEEIAEADLRFLLANSKMTAVSEIKMSAMTEHGQTPQYTHTKYACIVCGRSFDSERQLHSHSRSHRKPQTCNLCQEKFTHLGSLKRHMRSDHPNARSHHCELCLSSFALRTSLQVHVKSVHFHEKPHRCNQCGKTFAARQKLRWHLLNHTGERPYRCPVCLNCFARSDHMRRHLKQTHRHPEEQQMGSTYKS